MDKIKELGEVENLLIKKSYEAMEAAGTDTSEMGRQRIYKNTDDSVIVSNNYGLDILVSYKYSKDNIISDVFTGVKAMVESVRLKNECELLLTNHGIKNFLKTETPEEAVELFSKVEKKANQKLRGFKNS